MRFTLKPYQREALQWLAEHPRCAIFMPMGGGKTVTVLTYLRHCYDLVGETAPTLIVAPLRVARSVWLQERDKWEHLHDLTMVRVTGSAQERRFALGQPAQVYVINYDNLPWLAAHWADAWPYARVVCDESTRLKGLRTRQGAAQAAALRPWAHTRVTSWVNLTGTPAPNGLKDLWGQQWFLDGGRALGASYAAFEERWFAYKRVKDAVSHRTFIKPVILPWADREIHERIRPTCVTIDAAAHFDLLEPVRSVIEVELPPSARKAYRGMERQMFAALERGDIEALSGGGKTLKCLQIASGAAYLDDDTREWEVLHDEKIDALRSVVAEAAGMPVLVAYHFKSDLARLRDAFKEARVLDADPRTVDQWNAGEIPVLLAHPASAGHGLNLQHGGNIIVFFSHWWDLEKHDQIIERIGPMRQAQSGYKRPVFVYYIVARDTVDELVIARRDAKTTVQETLLKAMERTTQCNQMLEQST